MKVLDVILEQEATINNGRDLASAFTEVEWENIIKHFNRARLAATTDMQARMDIMDRINADVGRTNNAGNDANLWNRRARYWGMESPLMSPTWNDIYNHLRSFADTQTQLPAATLPPSRNITSTQDADQIRSWVPINVDSFENETALRNYLIEFRDYVSDPERNRNRSREWIARLNEDPSNRFSGTFNTLGRTLMNRLRENGSVSKDAVLDQLVGWVTVTDTTINQMLQSSRSSQD